MEGRSIDPYGDSPIGKPEGSNTGPFSINKYVLDLMQRKVDEYGKELERIRQGGVEKSTTNTQANNSPTSSSEEFVDLKRTSLLTLIERMRENSNQSQQNDSRNS